MATKEMKRQGLPAFVTPKKEAGAGRGFVNPRRVNESDEDYISPEMRYQMSKDLLESRESEATKKAYEKFMGMKKGGSVSKRADGLAIKGKTRGTMITMCGGGMTKRK
jgi:hypothetical protein